MKRFMVSTLAAAIAVMGLGSTAGAAHTTVEWKGQTWTISDNGTATVNPNGSLTLTRSGGGFSQVHVNRLLPAPDGESFVNAEGTPWVMVSYLDNAESRGLDLFVGDETLLTYPRVTGGSLFSCGGIAWTRYAAPATTEEEVLCVGTRSAGAAHTLYMGQRPDGTVDFNFDGTWYTSTLLRDNVGPFDFNDVHLRVREAGGTTGTFTDFRYGDDHVEEKSDCKAGSWQDYGIFANQGQCVKWTSAGK